MSSWSSHHIPAPPGRGRVETALCMYSRPDGVEVTLVGAVHFADLAYYNQLTRTFARVFGLVALGALFLVFTSSRGK
ncbi:MAG TPA: hypothetical protein VMT52_03805 [Planctomycetota bacterium]|nr:hypothetical protein [Planctomycetota bacterium]